MTLNELTEAIKANIIEILEDNGETVDLNEIEKVQIFGITMEK